jgi:hypothetical protein
MNAAGEGGHYTLFGTGACHLCELAEQMLLALCEEHPDLIFQKVDISDSDSLFERYGVRIPVLRDDRGGELGWPFTAAQLEAFIGGTTPATSLRQP